MASEIRWTLKPADPATFTGDAETALLGAANDGESVKLFYVRFSPGARTHWHAHAGPQTLLVTEGRCLVGREGHAPVVLGVGDIITIPPGERHWHGAGAGSGTAHIAINIDNRRTSWFEPVEDDDVQ